MIIRGDYHIMCKTGGNPSLFLSPSSSSLSFPLGDNPLMSLLHRTTGYIARRRLLSAISQCSGCPHHRLNANWLGAPDHHVRLLSSDSEPNTSVPEKTSSRQYSLLYARSPSRSTYPRVTLGFSTFNALYWLWYTYDFTPSVNASAYEKAALNQIDAETLDLLLVDSTMGYVGLGIALVIWGGSIWYPKHLVSAIWKREDDLAVSTLGVPFVKVPGILGGSKTTFTEEELKSESNVQFFRFDEIGVVGEKETNEILIKLDGDLGKKRGHLALQLNDPHADPSADSGLLSVLNKKNYLLDIGSEEEIVEGANEDLLKALLSQAFEEKKQTSGRRQAVKERADEEEYVQIKPKFGRGKKRR